MCDLYQLIRTWPGHSLAAAMQHFETAGKQPKVFLAGAASGMAKRTQEGLGILTQFDLDQYRISFRRPGSSSLKGIMKMMVSWGIEVAGIAVAALFLFAVVIAWVSSSEFRDSAAKRKQRSF